MIILEARNLKSFKKALFLLYYLHVIIYRSRQDTTRHSEIKPVNVNIENFPYGWDATQHSENNRKFSFDMDLKLPPKHKRTPKDWDKIYREFYKRVA